MTSHFLVDPPAAENLARSIFGIDAEATELVSYRDRNFRLETPGGERYVLKVGHPDEPPVEVAAQVAAMAMAEKAGLPVPRAVPSTDGSLIVAPEEIADGRSAVRLLTWLPGTFLAAVWPRPTPLLEELGDLLGRLGLALSGLDHEGARRHLGWDLAHFGEVRDELHAVSEGWRRGRAEGVLDRFETEVLPALPALPHGVIHNDANEYNVLVASGGGEEPRISGLIDFGDLVESVRVAELGVSCAYAMQREEDPLAVAASMTRGYHRALPLSGEEARVLPLMIEARLVMSVVKSSAERLRQPDNEYLSISEQPGWELLERLEEIGYEALERRLLEAVEDS